MSSETFCASAGCNRPVQSAILCTDHLAELVGLLGQAAWIIDQLRTAYTRQARFSAGSGAATPPQDAETVEDPTGRLERATGARTQPLVFHARAAEAAADYTAVIATWQGRVADHAGRPVRYPNPVTAALWITTQRRHLATFVDGGKFLDALASAHRSALQVINKPPSKWFAGKCSAPLKDGGECPRDLYADADTGFIDCPLCGTRHDLVERRTALLRHAEDVLATATEAARAIAVWSDLSAGENSLVRRLGMWAKRGLIEQRGTIVVGGRERPLYRVGDILDLMAREQRTQAGGTSRAG